METCLNNFNQFGHVSLVEFTQFSLVHPTLSIWIENTCLNYVEPLSIIESSSNKELFFATVAMQTASKPCLNPPWITSDTTPQWGQNINLICRHNSHRIMKYMGLGLGFGASQSCCENLWPSSFGLFDSHCGCPIILNNLSKTKAV